MSVSIHCQPVGNYLDELFEQEIDLIKNASALRKQAFSSGRRCAREAMLAAGTPAAALLIGKARQPQWPPGVVGSISHCTDLAIACVSGATGLAALGIDIENIGDFSALPKGYLFTQNERQWLQSVPESTRTNQAYLIFSAKESLYKVLHPVCGAFIDFLEVELKINAREKIFSFVGVSANVINLLQAYRPEGRFELTNSHVITGITLRSPDRDHYLPR